MPSKRTGSQPEIATSIKLKVIQIIREGKDQESIRQALLGAFSPEIPVVVYWWLKQDLGSDQEYQQLAQEELAKHRELWLSVFNILVDRLKGFDRWDEAMAKGRDVLKREVEKVVDAIQGAIYSHYGIDAHRPIENQDRDEWIVRQRIARERSSVRSLPRLITAGNVKVGAIKRLLPTWSDWLARDDVSDM
jgi:hypothetical protein